MPKFLCENSIETIELANNSELNASLIERKKLAHSTELSDDWPEVSVVCPSEVVLHGAFTGHKAAQVLHLRIRLREQLEPCRHSHAKRSQEE